MSSPPRRLARPLFTARGLHRAAVISLEFAAVVLGLWVLRAVVQHFGFVLVPVAVALLLSALLSPVAAWLRDHGLPRGLSVVAVLVVGVGVVGGLVTFVVLAVASHFGQLSDSVSSGIEQVQTWLEKGPLGLDANLLERGRQWLQAHEASLVSDMMTAFTTFGSLVAGTVLTLVILVMFLADGPRMWEFLLRLWRTPTRRHVDEAGREAFHSVVMYVRVTALIALVDAIGIGIGLLVVGVPLVAPLTALVFLGAFVPYVGAVVSGALAIAVTLVSNGPAAALIMLGVVITVQQLEGNVARGQPRTPSPHRGPPGHHHRRSRRRNRRRPARRPGNRRHQSRGTRRRSTKRQRRNRPPTRRTRRGTRTLTGGCLRMSRAAKVPNTPGRRRRVESSCCAR